jgi:hypothetical protein
LIDQAAMLRFSTTVTTQRAGGLDLSSLTEQTNPVPVSPLWSRSSFRFDIGRSGSVAPISGRLEHLHGITKCRGTRYNTATIRRISVNH